MSEVEAIYQDGVFKPLSEVTLSQNQRVRLTFQPVEKGEVRAWLDEVQRLQRQIVSERGYFPDSTLEIAADRAR